MRETGWFVRCWAGLRKVFRRAVMEGEFPERGRWRCPHGVEIRFVMREMGVLAGLAGG